MQIDRFRGDTSADSFTVTIKASGTPVNLTGCTFKLTVNTDANPVDSSHQVYQIVGSITDIANGVVEFAPNDAQADHTGVFYYDIEMIDSSGVRRTLVKDTYNYIQDITK